MVLVTVTCTKWADLIVSWNEAILYFLAWKKDGDEALYFAEVGVDRAMQLGRVCDVSTYTVVATAIPKKS